LGLRNLLTAERFGAELAMRMGLVHHIAAPDDPDAVVAAKVDDVLHSGPNAVREAKRLIRDVLAAPPHDRLSITSERIAACARPTRARKDCVRFWRNGVPTGNGRTETRP
jgi:methylglutaconyl-CoA hydratase